MTQSVFGQTTTTSDSTNINKWFIGYETLEMSMNNFHNFAGTLGYRLNPKNQIRIVVMDVIRSEEHLASSWQSMGVDGPNVTGRFSTVDIYCEWFYENWYYGLHAGYKNDQFQYLLGDQKINNHTMIAGPVLGYQKMNLFNVRHLFINFSMPFHYYFNPIHERKWGETKIREFKFTNNIWFFLGFNF